MFKRIVTIIAMIATSTLFFNEVARARRFVPFSIPTSIKERKKSCLPCAAAQGNSDSDPIDGLATLGHRTQILPFAPLQRSAFDGTIVNLVSTATGHLSFAVTDLKINAAMPVTFQRAYNSDNSEDRGLGAGWSFVFDDRITLSGDTATLSTGTGSVMTFRREGQSQHFVLKTDEPNAHQSFDLAGDNSIVEQAAGLTRTYKRQSASYRLNQIADNNGNTIKISFNAQGNVSRIAGSSGSVLTLEWSDGKAARLLAVTDNTNRRVTFKQDGQRLRVVTDAAGAEWTYDYQGGQLTRAGDTLGRMLLRARYDKAGRVVEAGDAAGANLYEYDSASNDVSRRTVVTDPMGAKTIFEHTERGSLSAISNDGQTLLQIDYNAMSRPIKIANSLTGDTVFNYDGQNRVVNQASSDGAFQTFMYDERGRVSSTTTNAGRTEYTRDEHGNITQAKSDDPAQSYQAAHNSRGQTVSIKSEAGSEISFEYDASGNTSAFSTNKSGRFQIETDAGGRVISRRLPSGALYRYEYDPRGMLIKQSDNRGRSAIFERDASGAVTGVVMASGNWMRATRDEAGRIIALSTSAGKSRHFAYDARGALTDYTDARGLHKHFNYDKRGRLESVESGDGNHTVFERDEKGRVKRVWSFNLPKGKERSSEEARPVAFTRGLGIPQLLPASYNVNLPLVTAPQEEDCLFNSSDGFLDNSGWEFNSGGCSDPFGEWGGGFGGGFDNFDPFFSPMGETCVQCVARQVAICNLEYQSDMNRIFGTLWYSLVPCISLGLLTVGAGALLCLMFDINGYSANALSNQQKYQACLLDRSDKCSQCVH
jgi:YD repeat-containing protein